MTQHRNFGGQKPSLAGIGNGAIDLRHLATAQQQMEAGVRKCIMDTNRDLFVALVAAHVDVPMLGEPINQEQVRRCAAAAIAAAPHYLEAIGMIKIEGSDAATREEAPATVEGGQGDETSGNPS